MSTEDFFKRIWDDAAAKLDETLLPNQPVTSDRSDSEPLVVTKFHSHLRISDDQAMDLGLIPDTRSKVPIPWYRRARWRWQDWREKAGRKIGGWIAGMDLSDPW